jgi:hypothetical protein
MDHYTGLHFDRASRGNWKYIWDLLLCWETGECNCPDSLEKIGVHIFVRSTLLPLLVLDLKSWTWSGIFSNIIWVKKQRFSCLRRSNRQLLLMPTAEKITGFVVFRKLADFAEKWAVFLLRKNNQLSPQTAALKLNLCLPIKWFINWDLPVQQVLSIFIYFLLYTGLEK